MGKSIPTKGWGLRRQNIKKEKKKHEWKAVMGNSGSGFNWKRKKKVGLKMARQ